MCKLFAYQWYANRSLPISPCWLEMSPADPLMSLRALPWFHLSSFVGCANKGVLLYLKECGCSCPCEFSVADLHPLAQKGDFVCRPLWDARPLPPPMYWHFFLVSKLVCWDATQPPVPSPNSPLSSFMWFSWTWAVSWSLQSWLERRGRQGRGPAPICTHCLSCRLLWAPPSLNQLFSG